MITVKNIETGALHHVSGTDNPLEALLMVAKGSDPERIRLAATRIDSALWLDGFVVRLTVSDGCYSDRYGAIL